MKIIIIMLGVLLLASAKVGSNVVGSNTADAAEYEVVQYHHDDIAIYTAYQHSVTGAILVIKRTHDDNLVTQATVAALTNIRADLALLTYA